MSAFHPKATEQRTQFYVGLRAKTCHGPLPCACESDVVLPKSCQRDMPKSSFCSGSGDAVGRHPTQTFNLRRLFASRARARLRVRHCEDQRGNAMKLPRRNFCIWPRVLPRCRPSSRFAWAQAYPSRPVRIIVPFPAGQATDTIARLMGQSLLERLGQPFVIENRPGAGGNIGTESVVRATPDGYTLLLVGLSNAMNATLYKKLNFNFIRDIAPVASIGGAPYVMVINPSVPAKTVPEFIAYAKANPSKINMAIVRQRVRVPCLRRTVQDDDRYQPGPRSVSRRLRSRSAQRTGAGRFRHHILVHPVHQGRHAARAGGDNCDPFGCAAGYSDPGRIRAWLRGEPMVWSRCAERHAR